MWFNRTNVFNKDLFNYNDLCVEFVKILLTEHKGIQRTALFLAIMHRVVVITQNCYILIYFMAAA
jgi:hypothetical protein